MNEQVVKEWALYVGDKIVTIYETKDDAADALCWYVDTYGEPASGLTIGQVSVAY